MPIFRVRDNQTGETFDIQGDTDVPPSEAEIDELLKPYRQTAPATPALPAPVPQSNIGPIRQAVGRYAQGVAGMVASVPESVGILADKIGQTFPAIDEGKSLEELSTYRLGQGIRNFYKNFFPVDEARPKSFVTDTLPSGAGSMVGAIMGGAAGRAAKLPAWLAVAGTGAAGGGAEGFREAKEQGGTDDQAWTSFLINAGLGTTEAVPISRWLNRLNKSTGGAISNAIREGSEEALQEVFQSVGSNISASKIAGYDPERPWYQGAGEGAAAGATLGTLGSLLFSAAGRRAARNLGGSEPEEPQAPVPGSNLRTPPGSKPPTDVEKFARDIGFTIRGLNAGGAVAQPTPEQLAAMSDQEKAMYAEILKQQGRQWDLTDQRKNSPTRGMTFYVPENATRDEMQSLFDDKQRREQEALRQQNQGAGRPSAAGNVVVPPVAQPPETPISSPQNPANVPPVSAGSNVTPAAPTILDPSSGFPIVETDVDPKTLSLSADVPNFKEDAGATGEVAGKQLKG